MASPVRIGIVGLHLESNAWAPVTTAADFRAFLTLEGDDVLGPDAPPPVTAFVERLRALRPAVPVPLTVCKAQPGGPCEQAFASDFARRVHAMVRAARLDGVFLYAHGAGTTTAHDDLDGEYFAAVRDAAGPRAPIVAELDLHANLTDAMLAAVDAVVAYRTNPHIDAEERARECADLLHALLDGRRLVSAAVRLPLLTPQVSQLTSEGEPMHPLFDAADKARANVEGLATVSVIPGFALADTREGGLAIVAAADTEAAARRAALDLSALAWRARATFERRLASIDEAVERAKHAGEDQALPRVVLADVADNPGGGARGNTTHLIAALHAARVRGCCVGLFFDPELAAEAARLGPGARFLARFNRAEPSPLSLPFEAEAEVAALPPSRLVNTSGAYAGFPAELGVAAALRLDGISVCVTSNRLQIFSTDYFEHFGIRTNETRGFVVKSRGHFRAGFAHVASGAYVLEVRAPGLTPADLSSVPFRRVRRPVYPLDRDAAFVPEARVFASRRA